MLFFKSLCALSLLASSAIAGFVVANDDQDMTGLVVNGIPYATRVKYMRLVSAVHTSHIHRIDLSPGQRSAVRAEWPLPIRRLRHHHCKSHRRCNCL